MIQIESLIKKLGEEDFDDLQRILLNLLEQNYRENLSTKNNILINVSGFRGIGKTTALIKFAETNDFTVIEPNEMAANIIRNRDGYERIFSPTLIKNNWEGWNNCVVDEGVDIKKLREKYENINIIGGYYLEKEEKIKEPDYLSQQYKIIKILGEDIDSLLDKLKYALKENKHSDYKMLMHNLIETGNYRDSIVDKINKQ